MVWFGGMERIVNDGMVVLSCRLDGLRQEGPEIAVLAVGVSCARLG